MQPIAELAPVSKQRLWTGRVLSTLVVLFLLMDGVMKVMLASAAVEGTKKVGYPESVVFPLGCVLLACTLLYAIPRTSVLGARSY